MDAHLSPFVLDVSWERTTTGNVDFYRPAGEDRLPAIVFVPGGPTPPPVLPRPRDWPLYRGYGALAATAGVIGAVVDHRLYHPGAFADAAEDVAAAIATVQADPRVDPARVALWFFSGGGLLAADYLQSDFVIALTYPVLEPFPGWPVDPRFLPVERVTDGSGVILSRAGRENPIVAEGVERFVRKAGPTIVDVPNGQHSFDILDHTEESRTAVRTALDLVIKRL